MFMREPFLTYLLPQPPLLFLKFPKMIMDIYYYNLPFFIYYYNLHFCFD